MERIVLKGRGEADLPPRKISLEKGRKMSARFTITLILLTASTLAVSQAQSPYESSADFARYAMKLRAQALLKVEPQVFVPTTSRFSTSRYPWKTDIVTTIFWIGEQATANNPVPNHKSS